MRFPARLAVLLMTTCLFAQPVLAQDDEDEEMEDTAEIEVVQTVAKQRKFYSSNALDMAIFSTSTLSKPLVNTDALTPLRFTWLFNFGFNFNYDFSNNFGAFTGLGIKNIGFIEKYRTQDSTVKRRVYVLGAPLGIKIGNLRRRNFVMLGGGADLAFNYREKGFIRRGNKEKFNEWFSERTPLIMPHVFAGASFDPGITIKAQYYPGNFLNPDFKEQVGTTTILPYFGYDVHLILFSLGFDIHYKKVKIKAKEDVKRTI